MVGGERYIIGESAFFHSLGSMHSQTLAKPVYIGSKTKEGLENYFKASLAHALLLEEHCPELSDLLPLVMGAVLDSKGDYKFIFMEDYSQGKTAEMRGMGWAAQREIPEAIRRIMEPPDKHFQYDDLAKAFVFVDGKLRILDLDQLPWLREHQQRAYQMRANLSLEQSLLEPHLIRT